jgi:amino acid transporter
MANSQPFDPVQSSSSSRKSGRTTPQTDTSFQMDGPEAYVASLAVSLPDTPLEHARHLLVGRPIPETLASRERLNRAQALATLSSDALSSVAYGTEASLAVLVAAGVVALTANLWIGVITVALMLIVGSSYRQTIHAYPSGGGSYIVARENLGTIPALVAAAALLIDYILTVSVSMASGIDAIAAALPAITPAKLGIEVAAIVLITLINMRGLRDSGMIFAFPTYFFLITFGLMLLVGVLHAFMHGGPTTAVPPPAGALPGTLVPLTPLLLLTAFASGCSAMTGVEAISNGVPAFAGDTPAAQSRHAAQTLTVMVALLVTFFLGTTYLAWRAGAVAFPNGDPTVTAQIARFAFQRPFGWLFYVVQTATLLILVFAANTSFADFPRLASILANDAFFPALFAYRGERIAFSVGIGVLGLVSTGVLLIFRGNVVALINLYALGVFVAFTLSQSGMVIHWLRRQTEAGWQRRLVANGVGALATALVTLVIAITKFDRGAWVVVVLIPLAVLGCVGIRRYYSRPRLLQVPERVTRLADVIIVPIFSHQELRASRAPAPAVPPHEPPPVGAPLHPWQQEVAQELAYAAQLAPTLLVVEVVTDRSEADAFCASWQAFLHTKEETPLQKRVTVKALISPYRAVVWPMVHFLEWLSQHAYAGKRVTILMPRETRVAWWEWPLRRHIAELVRRHLKRDTTLTVIDLPYKLG